MEYFDIIRKILNSPEFDRIDGYIYDDGDNEGQEVLQMYDWKDVEALNKELKRRFEELKIDTSEMSLHQETSNDGYVEFATDGNWVFADESFVCDNCGKLFRMETYGYANYYISERYGGIYCEECVEEDPSDYIETLINDPKRANTVLDTNALEDMGFEKIGERYASGWYGRDDRPEEILENVLNLYPNAEVIFNIIKTYNPFETEYETYIKYNDEEEDEEDC